jgi:hypothetical protein
MAYKDYNDYLDYLDYDQGRYVETNKVKYSDGTEHEEISMPQGAFWDLLEKAERMGREAARRDVIDAITEVAGKYRGSRSAQVNMAFDHVNNTIVAGSNSGAIKGREVLKAETQDLDVVNEADDKLAQRQRMRDEMAPIPDFLRDEKGRFVSEPTYVNPDLDPVKQAHDKLLVGWYQRGTELIYWNGETWASGPKRESLGITRLPISELEKLEYVDFYNG